MALILPLKMYQFSLEVLERIKRVLKFDLQGSYWLRTEDGQFAVFLLVIGERC